MAFWNVTPPERRLSWPERWTLLGALALLPLTALALRTIGLRRWQALLLRGVGPAGKADPPALPGPPPERARRTARLVAAATRRGLWRGSCLERSVVLCWLLARRGVPAELRIGVRLESGKLAAHAWVACAGTVLNDHDDHVAGYAAFERPILPPRGVP